MEAPPTILQLFTPKQESLPFIPTFDESFDISNNNKKYTFRILHNSNFIKFKLNEKNSNDFYEHLYSLSEIQNILYNKKNLNNICKNLINYYVKKNEIIIDLKEDFAFLKIKALVDFEEKIYEFELIKIKEEGIKNENAEQKKLYLKQNFLIGKLLLENRDLKKENENIKNESESIKKENENLKNEIEKLLQEREKSIDNNANFVQIIEDLIKEKEKLKQEIIVLSSNNIKLNNENYNRKRNEIILQNLLKKK